MFVLQHPLHEVWVYMRPSSSSDAATLWAMIVSILAVVRLGVLLNYTSKAAWFTAALVHLVEMYFVAFIVVQDRLLPLEDLSRFDAAKHGEVAFISGAVMVNAILFAVMWIITPSRTAARKSHSE